MSESLDRAARVLDHNFEVARHADVNVNSLLAATAFLALGGFTLFFPNGNPGELHIEGVPASDVFFFLFDAGIFLSVAFALHALHAGSAEDIRDPERTLLLVRPEALSETALEEQFENIASRYRAASLAKSLYVSRARAAIEFAMISLAALGTARLPDLSRETKIWLILAALGVYGYGSFWRYPAGRIRLELILESSLAALFLGIADPLGEQWAAIGASLAWIAVSRLPSPHSPWSARLRRIWAGAAAIVFVVALSA